MWSIFLAVLLSPLFVQTQAPAAGGTAEPPVIHLPDGTPVTLLLERTLTTRTATSGEAVEFRVLKDVKQDDLVVIAAGAHATGTVTSSERPGRKWKEGRLELRPEKAQLVNGSWAQLTAQPVSARGRSVKSESAGEMLEVTGQTLGFGIVLLPFWSLKKGHHAMLLGGSAFQAYLKGDVDMDRAQAASLQPSSPPGRSGSAVIHVYHLEDIEPPGVFHNIIVTMVDPNSGIATSRNHFASFYVGKAGIASARSGESFDFSLPPGDYWIRLHDKKTAQKLQVRDGEEYFVHVWANETRDQGREWLDQIKLEPAVVGAIRLANTNPLSPKRVKDPAGLDPQKLHADPR